MQLSQASDSPPLKERPRPPPPFLASAAALIGDLCQQVQLTSLAEDHLILEDHELNQLTVVPQEHQSWCKVRDGGMPPGDESVVVLGITYPHYPASLHQAAHLRALLSLLTWRKGKFSATYCGRYDSTLPVVSPRSGVKEEEEEGCINEESLW